MGKGSRRCLALLACAVLLAICMGFSPGTAAADSTDPGSSAEQASSSSASSSAQNDNSTTQSATATQSGGSGQSQTIVQDAPTQQTATASATSTQQATNVAAGGSATQHDDASAVGSATNENSTDQSSTQQQAGGSAASTGPAAGQAQTSSQSAPVTQKADATASSTQVTPINVNVVIRINSPGNNGPVTQSNVSAATATGDNSNATTQDVGQNQAGGGPAGGQLQSADQSAPTNQSANAMATSTQVAPLNANIVIRNKSPGDTGPVTQTNSSQATAQAANDNAVNQSGTQTQTLAGDRASSGQSQSLSQSAPTAQDANAIAVSTLSAPTNANISILIDGGAPDPARSGVLGTLIQIWIPLGNQEAATQTNSSSATASAGNTNQVTQSATQLQTGGSDGGSQMGGAGQSQTIEQSAPTTQTASAQATSEQAAGSGNSRATATQENSNQTAQRARQTGPGTQVIEQTAFSTQSGAAMPTRGSSARSVGLDGWSLASSFGVDAQLRSAPDRPSAESSMSPSRRSHSGAPRQRVPFPDSQKMPNASLGGASPSGGSHGAFAMLLLAFALTTPWWGRPRRLPSALRRLMAVVSRLERPG